MADDGGIAMLDSDAHNDPSPSGYTSLPMPANIVGIASLGLWLIDHCHVDDLAQARESRKRRELLLTIAP